MVNMSKFMVDIVTTHEKYLTEIIDRVSKSNIIFVNILPSITDSENWELEIKNNDTD